MFCRATISKPAYETVNTSKKARLEAKGGQLVFYDSEGRVAATGKAAVNAFVRRVDQLYHTNKIYHRN